MREDTKDSVKHNKKYFASKKFRNDNSLTNSHSQILPLSNVERKTDNSPSQNLTSVSNSSKKKLRKKLIIKLSDEEEIYYNNLFQYLDELNLEKIESKKAASFMKKSGLTSSQLKAIWLIASQSSIIYLDKMEFFIALRLISLAQNKLPYTIENIEKNIIPENLPKFNKYKINGNLNDKIIYKITNLELNKSKIIFDNNKNKNEKNILINKAINILSPKNDANNEDMIKKIITLISQFLQRKDYLNLKEFQVFSYLISISDKYEIPNKLPVSLVNFLSYGNFIDKNENKFPNKKYDELLNNINNIKKEITYITSENNEITKQFDLHKEKISFLFCELNNFQIEQEQIKQKLNCLNEECHSLLYFLSEKKNNCPERKDTSLNSCVYKNDSNSFSMHNPFNNNSAQKNIGKSISVNDYKNICKTINYKKNLYVFEDNLEEKEKIIIINNENKGENNQNLEIYKNDNIFFDENNISEGKKLDEKNKFNIKNIIIKSDIKLNSNSINNYKKTDKQNEKLKNNSQNGELKIKLQPTNEKKIENKNLKYKKEFKNNDENKIDNIKKKTLKLSKNKGDNLEIKKQAINLMNNKEDLDCFSENDDKRNSLEYNRLDEFNGKSNGVKNTKTQDFKLIYNKETKHSI